MRHLHVDGFQFVRGSCRGNSPNSHYIDEHALGRTNNSCVGYLVLVGHDNRRGDHIPDDHSIAVEHRGLGRRLYV